MIYILLAIGVIAFLELYQPRCPKCKGRMVRVPGWYKVTCTECGYTKNI